ncbi:MAG TPA: SIS domain-containing protein, partial [Pseudomonadales bacterium]|nr:SIS domain-containing protein [Pseudomonadales bacterium]
MSNIQRINNLITLTIENQTQLMVEVSDEIAFAGDRLTQCLLQDGKLLICGNGVSAAIADAFTSYLLNHFESERPPLPAICLCNTHAVTAIGIDSGF